MNSLARPVKYTVFTLLIFLSLQVYSQQKYMLCVGINNYTGSDKDKIDTWDSRTIINLKGCENDVDTISKTFIKYYGFSGSNIKKLLSRDAKRDSIIASLKEFAHKCNPNDFMVFFYSGHGSLEYYDTPQKNTFKNYENSIVPADAALPEVKDINNHELNALFLLFTQKGVHLTIIMDACHSGTNTRGATLYELSGVKEVEASPVVLLHPASSKATTPLAEQGALTLGACQDNELSREATAGDMHFGAFTYSLCRAIRQYSKASAQEIFNRTVSLLKFNSTRQVPVIEMNSDRKEKNLPGTDKATVSTSFPLISKEEPYFIQGGFLDGLSAGDILVSTGRNKDTIVIDSVYGPERARVLSINKNGLWKDKNVNTTYTALWPAWQPEPPVKVYIGAGLQPADLNRVVQQAAAMKKTNPAIRWVTPADGSMPQATIYYNIPEKVWKINKNGTAKPVIVSNAENAALVALKGLPVFLELPPSAALAAALTNTLQNNKNRNIGLRASADDANYLLAGTFNNGSPEYGWLSTIWGTAKAADFPVRTDFFSDDKTTQTESIATNPLYDRLYKLGKIGSWLTLQSPAPDGSIAFPFSIKIRNTRGRLVADEKQQPVKVYTGDTLKINFERDHGATSSTDTLFIYVFSIDPKGNMLLLFPWERTSIFNYPNADPNPWLATIRNTTPGVYHFFLLSCKERILNTDVFNQGGVITRAAEFYDNPLEALINDGGAGGRGSARTPANWLLKRVDVLTTEKPVVRK